MRPKAFDDQSSTLLARISCYQIESIAELDVEFRDAMTITMYFSSQESNLA